MKVPNEYKGYWDIFGLLAAAILVKGFVKVTKIVDEKHTITMTRRLFNGKIDKREKRVDIVLTVGEPNSQERKIIAAAKKTGRCPTLYKFPPEPKSKKR